MKAKGSWVTDIIEIKKIIGYGEKIIYSILILLVTKALLELGNVFIDKILNSRLENNKFGFEEKRIKTLSYLLKSVYRYTIYFMGVVIIFTEVFHMNLAPVLAGAGVVGLAVGFGAQGLVKDIITGFFILFEDQFVVGDYITTAGLSGIVEEMGLRVTRLRDFSGELHIIPNGEITKVTNHARGSMRALVDIEIAYENDLEKVISVSKHVCNNVKENFESVVQGPDVLGISAFNNCGMTLRIVAQVKAMEQWGIEREIRRQLKEAFDREGIEIPYPKMVLLTHKGEKELTENNVPGNAVEIERS